LVGSARERVCVDERRHGIVLAGAFVRAAALAVPGGFAVAVGWPATIAGAVLLSLAAAIVVRSVWRWERTRVVLTTEKLFVVHGTVRRRAAAVRLARIGAVEIEQSILGRLLDYGTIVVGDLEITHVPRPRRLIERMSA
jgi:uncharacterized membrane protein YdbT with pleckstrin-like domain